MRVVRFYYGRALKRLLILIVGSSIFYWICLRNSRYSESFETVVKVPDPKLVWEFVADFSNQQRLNPAVVDFEIEYERGNYDNWEYAVLFREGSTRLPLLTYETRAVFRVLPESRKTHVSQPYRILADLTSCVLGYCTESNSEMTFTQAKAPVAGRGVRGEDQAQLTKIREVVHFDCPPILAILCFRGLRAEKKLIYDNVVSSADMMFI